MIATAFVFVPKVQAFAEIEDASHLKAYVANFNLESISAYEYSDNCAFLIGETQSVVLSLGEGNSDRYESIVSKISINGGLPFDISSTADFSHYGMQVEYNVDWRNLNNEDAEGGTISAYCLIISPSLAGNNQFNYGKYELEFSFYYIDDQQNYVQTYETYAFHVLKASDYSNNISFENTQELFII